MSEDLYIELLGKQFSSELNEAEAAQLLAWEQASAENAQMATDLRAIWTKAAQFQAPSSSTSLDLDADFQKVWSKIEQSQAPKPMLIVHRRTWLRVAAMLVFLLAAMGLFRYGSSSTTPFQTVVASNDATKALQLPDGSKVWLHAGSMLKYPEHFDSDKRQVMLDGEAYFEVSHRPEQAFLVQLPDEGKVEVLGTHFSVNTQNNHKIVLVKTGKVRFTPKAGPKGVVLVAGQRAEYDPGSNQIKVTRAASFNELAWQTGGLEFIATPMRQVIHDLEAYYHVKIELQNPDLLDCVHTAPLTTQAIDKVLESLSLTYQIKVRQTAPDHFVLEGGNCKG